MPWHDDDGPVPERDQEELLAVVRTKAERVRRRRLEVACGVAAALVLLVGSVAVAGIGDQEQASTRLRTAGPGPTTASGGDSATAEPGTTGAPPSGDASAVSTSLPSDLAPNPPGVQDTPPATTADAQPPPATTPPADTQDPSDVQDFVAPPGERCGPSEVVVTASTDRPTYAVGQDVTVTMTARNQSQRTCARPTSFFLEIADQTGAVLVGYGTHGDYIAPGPPPLQPGETDMQALTWHGQAICGDGGCAPAAPGSYTAVATMNDYRSGPVVFTIG